MIKNFINYTHKGHKLTKKYYLRKKTQFLTAFRLPQRQNRISQKLVQKPRTKNGQNNRHYQ